MPRDVRRRVQVKASRRHGQRCCNFDVEGQIVAQKCAAFRPLRLAAQDPNFWKIHVGVEKYNPNKTACFFVFFGVSVFLMRGVVGKVRFPPYARFRRVRSEGTARKTNPRSEKNGCRELNIRGMRKRGKIKVAEIYVCIAKVLFRSKKHPFLIPRILSSLHAKNQQNV